MAVAQGTSTDLLRAVTGTTCASDTSEAACHGLGSVATASDKVWPTRHESSPGRRNGTSLGLRWGMKTTAMFALAFFGFSLASLVACRNTAEGVKDDTQNAVHKTGDELKKAGDTMSDAGSKD